MALCWVAFLKALIAREEPHASGWALGFLAVWVALEALELKLALTRRRRLRRRRIIAMVRSLPVAASAGRSGLHLNDPSPVGGSATDLVDAFARAGVLCDRLGILTEALDELARRTEPPKEPHPMQRVALYLIARRSAIRLLGCIVTLVVVLSLAIMALPH